MQPDFKKTLPPEEQQTDSCHLIGNNGSLKTDEILHVCKDSLLEVYNHREHLYRVKLK